MCGKSQAASVKSTTKFNVGDRVTILPTRLTGTVVRIDLDSTWPVRVKYDDIKGGEHGVYYDSELEAA